MPAGVQRLQYGPVTDQSQVPVEPDGTQPESAEENSGLSQDERAELERLRAETAELQSKTAATGRRRRFSWRTPVSIVLIVLGCVLALVSVIGVWAGLQVVHIAGKDSDGVAYMAHVGGLAAGVVLFLALRPRHVRLLECVWDPEGSLPPPA